MIEQKTLECTVLEKNDLLRDCGRVAKCVKFLLRNNSEIKQKL